MNFKTLLAIALSIWAIVLLYFEFWRPPPKVSLNGVRCREIENEADYFQQSAEVSLPKEAEIVLSCDDHSGFHQDGEYYVVFDTTTEAASMYLNTPLWGEEWQQGPVPEVIRDNLGLSKWEGAAFDSDRIHYVAVNQSRQNTSLYERWWNGRLLVVDVNNRRVFYSKWDF